MLASQARASLAWKSGHALLVLYGTVLIPLTEFTHKMNDIFGKFFQASDRVILF